jgi:hypothetical protein
MRGVIGKKEIILDVEKERAKMMTAVYARAYVFKPWILNKCCVCVCVCVRVRVYECV